MPQLIRTIAVTDNNLANGGSGATNCPVAKALQDHEYFHPTVYKGCSSFSEGDPLKVFEEIPHGENLYDWITSYDRDDPVEPVTIGLFLEEDQTLYLEIVS